MELLKTTLSPVELKRVAAARAKAFTLYEGKQTPHRSCGIALAETFNLPTRPYQSLRRGGLTGEGECGAIKAGELVLGEYLGDPDPTGKPTAILREAAKVYREEWTRRVDRGSHSHSAAPDRHSAGTSPSAQLPVLPDIICNHLTAPFPDFQGEERQSFCTNIAAQVAEIVAEILLRAGVDFEVTPIAAPGPGAGNAAGAKKT